MITFISSQMDKIAPFTLTIFIVIAALIEFSMGWDLIMCGYKYDKKERKCMLVTTLISAIIAVACCIVGIAMLKKTQYT